MNPRSPRLRCASTLISALLLCFGNERDAAAEPRSKADTPSASQQRQTRASQVERGFFIDQRGRRVAFEPLYEGWFGAQRYELYPLRAILENIGLLGVEVALYWSDPSSNFVDWQFPDLGSKLTSREAFRFDDNLLRTNYVYHPFAGTIHYVTTRANGFGVLPSFAAAAGSSAIYELLLEWKELVSLNDLVVTPFGGTAMGEFFYQLGNYINSEPVDAESHSGVGEVLHEGVEATLGLPRDLHDAIDSPRPPPSVPKDNLGLSSAYFHRFRALAALESIDTPSGPAGPLLGWDLDFALAAMPGFLRVGKFKRSFSNGNFTSFQGRLLFARGAHDSELLFDSHLFGRYEQDVRAAADGKSGYANEVALAVGLDYFTTAARHRGDAYGIVHLLKPTERLWLELGPAQLHFATEAAIDFAAVHSIAYETYAQVYGEEGTKSSLQRHGYAHAWGFSGGALATLAYGGLELGARARFGHYESLEGADRTQEEVTQEMHGTEDILRVSSYLRAEPTRSPFAGKLELAVDSRRSSLREIIGKRRDVRFLTAFGLRF